MSGASIQASAQSAGFHADEPALETQGLQQRLAVSTLPQLSFPSNSVLPSMTDAVRDLIERYYAAFNRQDMSRFFALLTEDVVHDVNQGQREVGLDAFAQFMAKMNRSYREQIVDLVVMTEPGGTRAAAEFTVLGTYLTTDEGLPEARGQTYRLAAGAFFEIRDGKVARISNYYNLQEWLRQVGA